MPTPTYDAIIVGSGITGGWAAKELTEKGLNTLILEAGRPIKPEQDYVEHVPVWELKYRGWDQRQVGGKSITWGRQSYRWSDLDFEANLRDGIAIDWPIRYKDIEPWYGYVEDFIGVSGQPENLPQLPDSHFLPPMEFTCVEQDVREAMFKHFDDRILTIGRTAILTRNHQG